MSENKTTVRKNITIKKYQDEWLKKHKEFNLSGAIQEMLDQIISETKSMSSYVNKIRRI